MACEHLEWVYPPTRICDYSGEEINDEPYSRYTFVDISRGAYKCTQCGEIGYYTGHWKEYYEKGTPCSGSDGVSRNIVDKDGSLNQTQNQLHITS